MRTDCEVYRLRFFRMLKCELESFRIFDIWLFSVRFSSIVKPSSFHSVTLSSSVLLQQICNCSSLSLSCRQLFWCDKHKFCFARWTIWVNLYIMYINPEISILHLNCRLWTLKVRQCIRLLVWLNKMGCYCIQLNNHFVVIWDLSTSGHVTFCILKLSWLFVSESIWDNITPSVVAFCLKSLSAVLLKNSFSVEDQLWPLFQFCFWNLCNFPSFRLLDFCALHVSNDLIRVATYWC